MPTRRRALLSSNRASRLPLNRIQRVAFASLMTVRCLCAAAWLCMCTTNAWPFALALAAWNVAPAVLARRDWHVTLWMVVVWDVAVVVLGLRTLPDYGTLHGGELVSLAAVPAALEVGLSLFLIFSSRSKAPRTRASEFGLNAHKEDSGPPREKEAGRFFCFNCGEQVNFGISQCDVCEQPFRYGGE